MSASSSFGSKRPFPGTKYRTGDLGRIVDKIYTDVDAAFVAAEAATQSGWAPCRVVQTANIANFALATKAIDSVTVVAGDRVLVKGQSNSWENGIYVVGAVTGTCVLTRATDLADASHLALGDAAWVTEGTSYANTSWRITSLTSLVFGTSGTLAFTQQTVSGIAAALYDANTILAANADNTPLALTVGASTLVGRKASGDISAMSATEARAVLTCDTLPKSLALIQAGMVAEAQLTAQAPSATLLGVQRIAVIPVSYTDIAPDAATAVGPTLPANSLIMRAFYIVTSAFTSATDAATLAIGVLGNANGIVTATAISAGGNVWDEGPHEAIPTGAIADMCPIGESPLKLLFTEAGGEALTAGALTIIVEYVVYA